MNRQVEAVIGFSDRYWTARIRNKVFRDPELSGLRKTLVHYCRENCREAGQLVLRFDMRDIPRWFHQYQTHYFNEIIELNA